MAGPSKHSVKISSREHPQSKINSSGCTAVRGAVRQRSLCPPFSKNTAKLAEVCVCECVCVCMYVCVCFCVCVCARLLLHIQQRGLVCYRSATDPMGPEVIWALGAGCRNI